MGQRKIRVAVVFGGRSTEHAVSCASAGLSCRPSTTTGTRWCPSASPPTAGGCSSPATRPGWRCPPGPYPRSSRWPWAAVRSPRGLVRRLGLAGDEPWLGAAGPRRGRRRAAAVAWSLRRGRHAAGPAGDDRHPVRRRGRLRQRGRHGQGVHEAAHGRARPAGRPAYVVVRDRDWRVLPNASGCSTTSASSAGRCSSSPPAAAPASGPPGFLVSRTSSPAIEAARAHDPKVLVEAAVDGIEVECAVLEGPDGGPPEASVPGQVMVAALGLLRLRGEIPGRRDHHASSRPHPRPGDRRGPGGWPAPRSTRSPARAWRGSTSSTPGGPGPGNEINTMPGMTPASGFPMMWAATGSRCRS